ncbi:MAG: glycoside hydrolase family protein [Asticcacaulis sp.]
MRARQKVSRAGVELIKSFEGLRSTAARLPDGRWTLGYGHTFSAREGARVTQEDADALLRFDLLPIVDAINNAILVPINQNQFDALVSFCFNIGVDNFVQSSVLKCINEGRMTEAALAMDSWRSAEFNGQTYVLAPLIRRRAAEKNLFLTPEDTAGNAPSLLVRPTMDTAPAADARPSELNAPDRGGVLSAYPMGQPGLSPYAQPIPQAPQAAPQPAPERQVIDLGSFTPRAVEMPLSPYANPIRTAPETVVESLPDGFVPSAVRPVPAPNAEPQMSPAVQAALARAQEEQRLREDADRQAAAFAAQQEWPENKNARIANASSACVPNRPASTRKLMSAAARNASGSSANAWRAKAPKRLPGLNKPDLNRPDLNKNAWNVNAPSRPASTRKAATAPSASRKSAIAPRRPVLNSRVSSRPDLNKNALPREAAAAQAAAPVSEDAEKARKAEAAAALMRLYSPYGGGALGRPLAATPAVMPPQAAPAPEAAATPAPAFTPYAPQPVAQEFTNQSVIAPASAESAPIEVTAPAVEAVPRTRRARTGGGRKQRRRFHADCVAAHHAAPYHYGA